MVKGRQREKRNINRFVSHIYVCVELRHKENE
jgi:hypothetical protein